MGREDRALLENRFARFGVSEYGGLLSMWVQPKDECGAPGEAWIIRIEQAFRLAAVRCFGPPLTRIGVMSDGTSVFKRID
jgi:hypothetical protein